MPALPVPIPSSTCIASATYDPMSSELTIQFRQGQTHTYNGVPASVVAGLATASSAGQYFNANIRNVY